MCTTFEYNMNTSEDKQSCKIWTTGGFTGGDGDENSFCFQRKEAVDSQTIPETKNQVNINYESNNLCPLGCKRCD